MHKTYILAIVLAAAGCLAASAAPVDNCGFEKVPRNALFALQEARGKPFTAGAVFVNGKYLPPPYVVSRYGTAISINGHQVTGQIIPWSKFRGVRPAAAVGAAPASAASDPGKVEQATSLDDLFSGDDAETPSAAAPEPAPAPAPAAPAAAPADDDIDDTLEDLFGDGPAKPKAKARPAPARRPAPRVAPEPEEEPPLDKFEHTSRTRQLLDSIDKQRTSIDRSLRANEFLFFSPRYSSVSGNLRILGSMVEKLPDAMRDATSAEDLYARLRKAGLGFISMEVCTDLYANKLTFPSLYDLRTRVREEIKRRKAMSAEGSY